MPLTVPVHPHCPGAFSVFLCSPKCPRVDDKSPGCPSVREAWRRVTYPHSENRWASRRRGICLSLTEVVCGVRRKGLPRVEGSRRPETCTCCEEEKDGALCGRLLAAGPRDGNRCVSDRGQRTPRGKWAQAHESPSSQVRLSCGSSRITCGWSDTVTKAPWFRLVWFGFPKRISSRSSHVC